MHEHYEPFKIRKLGIGIFSAIQKTFISYGCVFSISDIVIIITNNMIDVPQCIASVDCSSDRAADSQLPRLHSYQQPAHYRRRG